MRRAPRLIALSVCSPSASSAQQLTIGGYVKISEVRVTRTVTEYVYRATLTNTGPPLASATVSAASVAAATTIVEGSLTFGPVGQGESVSSADTFTFRQDRSVPFDFSNIQWTITPVAGDRPPVANAGPDQAVSGIGILVRLDGSGSTDPDGDPLSYAWTLIQRPLGSTAALAGPTSVAPTLCPTRRGPTLRSSSSPTGCCPVVRTR